MGKSATCKSIDKIEVEETGSFEYYLESLTIQGLGNENYRTENITKLLFDNGYRFKFQCPLMTNELTAHGPTYAACSVCNKHVSIVNDIEDFNDKIAKGLCVL